jgi:hypothetical protein
VTSLDTRVRRSAHAGLVKRLKLPTTRYIPEPPDPQQMPPGLTEEAVDEIVALYRQTRRSIEEYIDHPFTPGRVVDAECGTPSGYRRHRRLDEPACDDCLAAHSKAVKSRPGYVERHGNQTAA